MSMLLNFVYLATEAKFPLLDSGRIVPALLHVGRGVLELGLVGELPAEMGVHSRREPLSPDSSLFL